MEKKIIELVIERGEKGEFWGRLKYHDNLITDSAPSIPELETKMTELLETFENLDPSDFEFAKTYDVYSLFEDFSFINITKFAELISINPSLLRQYASGVKNPSEAQLKKIQDGFHVLGNKMEQIDLVLE